MAWPASEVLNTFQTMNQCYQLTKEWKISEKWFCQFNEVSKYLLLRYYVDTVIHFISYHKRWFWENWLHFEHCRLNKVGNTGFLTFSGQNLAFLRVLSHWKHWDEWFRVARYQKRPGTSKGREVDVTQRTNGRVNRELCASEITLLWEEHKM